METWDLEGGREDGAPVGSFTLPRVLFGVAAREQNVLAWGSCWWKGVLVCQLGSWWPRCPEMMGRVSYWLWLGFLFPGHAEWHRWFSWHPLSLLAS